MLNFWALSEMKMTMLTLTGINLMEQIKTQSLKSGAPETRE